MASLCSGSNGWLSYAYDSLTNFPYGKQYFSQPALQPIPLSKALLEQGDDTTSNAIIATFIADVTFGAFSQKETDAILARDAEDGDKLAAGIKKAVAKGVVEAEPPVEPVCKIDVAGKSADVVSAEMIAKMGDAPSKGCVLVLQGLSGTGKGTTVAKLQATLPRAVSWSNGNVFRSLTLLAVSYCAAKAIEFNSEALTPELLAELMKCLEFGKFNDKFDIRINGIGHDLLVSEVANTTLKEPRVSKAIPTVAELTQGEVIKFAEAAAAAMSADGMNVLMEGRAQTLDYVRTPHRFELTLAQPLVIGQRRAAQRMMASALTVLKDIEAPTETQVFAALKSELEKMASTA